MKEERFRQLFGAFGTLTDCSLKFTKDGKFRKFGFIGFKSEEEAQKALGHLHKSFVDTSRITVSWPEPDPACLSKVTTRSFPPHSCPLSDCDVRGLPHWFTNFHAYESPRELVKTEPLLKLLGPVSRVSDSICSGEVVDLRICMSNKLPGDVMLLIPKREPPVPIIQLLTLQQALNECLVDAGNLERTWSPWPVSS